MSFYKKNRNPYTRKLKKPRYFTIHTPVDIWSHIYGLSSSIGLIITIGIIVYNYINPNENKDFNYILTILVFLLASVLFMFLISVIYYSNRLKKYSQIPADYSFLKEQTERHDIILNQICECSHIVTHYYRNLDFMLQDIIDKDEDVLKEDELISAINKFDYFLINITTNLQSYFSQITDDNCSITIKLLNFNDSIEENEPLVRTYFRDPVNFKKRRNSDSICSPCSVNDNTAFSIIMDSNYQNIYFSEDRLPDLYENHQYKNPNLDWHKYYHSTLVVPISIVTGKDSRIVLGFLSVDNFKGGLATNSNKEYLFFIADLLYLAFSKFNDIIELAKLKNLKNEKIDRYTNWN
ncbi:hypothetical protein ACXIHB_04770 [Tenacibaculum sp. IMCC1]|uniref:GAF domain-containing protein n=1 Tax=Tenacibaculum sp. Pbs-1 TaxID=3238748 RepID=A0AB33KWR1_9FLAO